MTPLRNVVIDETRWPRMFEKLRRVGLYADCSAKRCEACNASAQRFLLGLVRSSRAIHLHRALGRQNGAVLRRPLAGRLWSLLLRLDAPPRIMDLVASGPVHAARDNVMDASQALELEASHEQLYSAQILGPVNVTISWTAEPVPLAAVAAHRMKGGVYILMNDKGNVLKAGRGSFPNRAAHYIASHWTGNRKPHAMYLGTLLIHSPSRHHDGTVQVVERVISRTLMRLHEPRPPSGRRVLSPIAGERALPLEGAVANTRPRDVINYVRIDNVLPRGLVPEVRVAYNGGVGHAHPRASERNLFLTTTQSQWEV